MVEFVGISIILGTLLCIKITSTKSQGSRKDVFRNRAKSSSQRLFLRIYLLRGVLIAVDKGTNAVGNPIVVFAIPGELGKLGNGPQSNEGAADADASEEPVLRLSGTDGCFLCPPPPRRLGGDGKALGLKLSSGRLVQSSIDADDDEVGDGGNNAGNAEGGFEGFCGVIRRIFGIEAAFVFSSGSFRTASSALLSL